MRTGHAGDALMQSVFVQHVFIAFLKIFSSPLQLCRGVIHFLMSIIVSPSDVQGSFFILPGKQ